MGTDLTAGGEGGAMLADAAAAGAMIGVVLPGRMGLVTIKMVERLDDCGDLAHVRNLGGSVTLVMPVPVDRIGDYNSTYTRGQ